MKSRIIDLRARKQNYQTLIHVGVIAGEFALVLAFLFTGALLMIALS